MSDLSEIKNIRTAVAALTARLDELQSSALTVEIPAVKFELLPGEAVGLTWDEAVAWAKEQGGELPTRQEMLALFGNLKSEFSENWYWTSEQRAGTPDCAWVQYFYYGGQSYGRKSGQYRARAVRRLPI